MAGTHRSRIPCSPQDPSIKEVPVLPEAGLVPADIFDVRRANDVPVSGRDSHAVILKARDSDRYLALFISPSEGTPLALSLESVEVPRPLTHQLAARIVSACGARVVEVTITRLVESTFYATIVLDAPGGRQEVDARPSDALNLAILGEAPIRIEAGLLSDVDQVGGAAWWSYPGRTEIVAAAQARRRELEDHLGSLDRARRTEGPSS
jgi:bifunctional DNase/RNase